MRGVTVCAYLALSVSLVYGSCVSQCGMYNVEAGCDCSAGCTENCCADYADECVVSCGDTKLLEMSNNIMEIDTADPEQLFSFEFSDGQSTGQVLVSDSDWNTVFTCGFQAPCDYPHPPAYLPQGVYNVYASQQITMTMTCGESLTPDPTPVPDAMSISCGDTHSGSVWNIASIYYTLEVPDSVIRRFDFSFSSTYGNGLLITNEAGELIGTCYSWQCPWFALSPGTYTLEISNAYSAAPDTYNLGLICSEPQSFISIGCGYRGDYTFTDMVANVFGDISHVNAPFHWGVTEYDDHSILLNFCASLSTPVASNEITVGLFDANLNRIASCFPNEHNCVDGCAFDVTEDGDYYIAIGDQAYQPYAFAVGCDCESYEYAAKMACLTDDICINDDVDEAQCCPAVFDSYMAGCAGRLEDASCGDSPVTLPMAAYICQHSDDTDTDTDTDTWMGSGSDSDSDSDDEHHIDCQTSYAGSLEYVGDTHTFHIWAREDEDRMFQFDWWTAEPLQMHLYNTNGEWVLSCYEPHECEPIWLEGEWYTLEVSSAYHHDTPFDYSIWILCHDIELSNFAYCGDPHQIAQPAPIPFTALGSRVTHLIGWEVDETDGFSFHFNFCGSGPVFVQLLSDDWLETCYSDDTHCEHACNFYVPPGEYGLLVSADPGADVHYELECNDFDMGTDTFTDTFTDTPSKSFSSSDSDSDSESESEMLPPLTCGSHEQAMLNKGDVHSFELKVEEQEDHLYHFSRTDSEALKLRVFNEDGETMLDCPSGQQCAPVWLDAGNYIVELQATSSEHAESMYDLFLTCSAVVPSGYAWCGAGSVAPPLEEWYLAPEMTWISHVIGWAVLEESGSDQQWSFCGSQDLTAYVVSIEAEDIVGMCHSTQDNCDDCHFSVPPGEYAVLIETQSPNSDVHFSVACGCDELLTQVWGLCMDGDCLADDADSFACCSAAYSADAAGCTSTLGDEDCPQQMSLDDLIGICEAEDDTDTDTDAHNNMDYDSPSPSASQSDTPSPTASPTASATVSDTQSATASRTATISVTPSITPTPSVSFDGLSEMCVDYRDEVESKCIASGCFEERPAELCCNNFVGFYEGCSSAVSSFVSDLLTGTCSDYPGDNLYKRACSGALAVVATTVSGLSVEDFTEAFEDAFLKAFAESANLARKDVYTKGVRETSGKQGGLEISVAVVVDDETETATGEPVDVEAATASIEAIETDQLVTALNENLVEAGVDTQISADAVAVEEVEVIEPEPQSTSPTRTVSPTPSPTSTVSPTPSTSSAREDEDDSDDDGGSSDDGALIGGLTGGLIGGAVILAACMFAYKKQQGVGHTEEAVEMTKANPDESFGSFHNENIPSPSDLPKE